MAVAAAKIDRKIRIGDLLVQNNLITEEQLMSALSVQKENGKRLGRTLTDMGFIEEDQLLELLSQQMQVQFIRLNNFEFDAELTQRLPETYARRFRALILKEDGGVLVGVGISGLVRPDVELLAVGGVLDPPGRADEGASIGECAEVLDDSIRELGVSDQGEAAAQYEARLPLVLLDPVFLGRDLPPWRVERDRFGGGHK